ncbi:hypothetical protein OHT77_24135 [Streptomyces sp. NBC_00252]|uniref:hypothetical protein n=1 Tax=Streptomyces sp. NBC_00252 TaxID=2975691 RepID=UPI002E2A5AB1|nr:hypothetical protein [Streptomyces sp. NBC_00252]
MERTIVVDASIARSSGTTEHPVSKACRDFLQEMYSVGHKAAFDAVLMAEWRKHQSGYALRWFGLMQSRRRVVSVKCPTVDREYLAKLINEADNLTLNEQQAALKDVHLAHCAWVTDGLVSSLDDTVRNIFTAISRNCGKLGGIVWVNPSKAEEVAIDWLKAGARTEEDRKLKNRSLDGRWEQ